MVKSRQFQVASYAFFLDYLVENIANLEVDTVGGVWLPNRDKYVEFGIDFMRNKIEYFYKNTLIKILKSSDRNWDLDKKCKSCRFVERCKGHARNTWRSLPYLNEEKTTQLKKKSSVVDIENLSAWLQKIKIGDKIAAAGSSDENSGGNKIWYESYIDAYNEKKPQFMGYTSLMAAKETDHSIYIYLQIDNFSQRPFVYGIAIIETKSNKKIWDDQCFATDYRKHKENEIEVYSEFVDRFVGDLAHTLHLWTRKSLGA